MSMKLSVADGHLCNMGRMVEEMESKLRNSLDQVLLYYRIHISIGELSNLVISSFITMTFQTRRKCTWSSTICMLLRITGILWKNKRNGLHTKTTIWSGAVENPRQLIALHRVPETILPRFLHMFYILAGNLCYSIWSRQFHMDWWFWWSLSCWGSSACCLNVNCCVL